VLCRFQGAWRFDQLTLAPRPSAGTLPDRTNDTARALLSAITYERGVNPEWFFLPPAPINKPSSPTLVERNKANPNASGLENFVWNDAVLAQAAPSTVSVIRSLKVDKLYVFHSFDGSLFPRFRLYPDNDFRPTPWITNRWGWLSAEVTFAKPPRTIRVGIIGDSTSHNQYAFYLQSFLDAWARQQGFDVRFEVLNASRQGLGRDDGISSLKYELSPMGLDYVYAYYAPSFSLNMSQMALWGGFPPDVKAGEPTHPVARIPRLAHQLLDPLADRSALARRIRDVAARGAADSILQEPDKPEVKLLIKPATDPYYGTLAGQLDRIKAIADSTHTHVIASTERLCVWDGMGLNNGTSHHLYEVLNGPLFWPFSYRQLRQMLALHNGVITAWAKANEATLVDIDGRMPRLPDLYTDAHHDVPIGQRLRAWLIFQAMIPRLSADLRSKRIPKDNGPKTSSHPYLDKEIDTLDRNQYLTRIDAAAAAKPASEK
jgi:hypothetical protein